MAEPVKIGRRGENRVAQDLKGKGFQVKLSPGSLGPSDLKASKPRKSWFVQVKTSQGPQPAWPGPQDYPGLRRFVFLPNLHLLEQAFAVQG